MQLRSYTHREKRTWATGAIPIGAPRRYNYDKEMFHHRTGSRTRMARVGFADGIYGEGTDSCNRNIVGLGLGKGHGNGRRGGVQNRERGTNLFIGKIMPI